MDREEIANPKTKRRPGPIRGSGASIAVAGFFIGIAAAALGAAPGLAAGPLSVEQAVEIARENNPEILSARQDLTIAQGRLQKARYWNPFNPAVEGGAASRRFDGGGSATQPSGGASLEVEVAGQRGKRIEEAQRNLVRVEAEVGDVERRILAQVKEAFYAALVFRERLGIFRRVEELNRRLHDASLERFQAGETPKLEANLAQIRYDRSRKDTLGAERDSENGLRELERTLGRDPRGDVEIAGGLKILPLELDRERLVALALLSRPDLRAKAAEIDRIDAEASLTRRLVVPNPTLRALYDEESETAGSRDRIVGGGISIPIPLFDRKQAELTALSGEKSRAVHERDATVLKAKTEVGDAWRSFDAARRAVTIFEAGTRERIAEGFGFLETAYRVGKIDLLRLITGENDLIEAELSYLSSVSDYWVAYVALERAVGAPITERSQP